MAWRALLLTLALALSARAHVRGPFVYVANNFANSISVIDMSSHAVVTTISDLSQPRAMALSRRAIGSLCAAAQVRCL